MRTETKKAEKRFDAIKTMREIRDNMSLKIMDMTYEEQREYLDKLLDKKKTKTVA